jgi:hypothetical protein
MKNLIKALFLIRSSFVKSKTKSFYFKVVKFYTGKVIENSIKSSDKSLLYSFRSSVSSEAEQFQLFEYYVVSDSYIRQIKADIT